MRTPWGESQTTSEYGEGVTSVSTSGHGGFKLDAARNRQVDSRWRMKGGWYEEDVDWAIVAVTFPDYFQDKEVRNAERTLVNWYPHQWEAITGEELGEEDSHVLAQEAFRDMTQDLYVAVSASGSSPSNDVPRGYTLVFAVRGGRTATGRYASDDEGEWLVPNDEYDARSGFGFVIEEDRHERVS